MKKVCYTCITGDYDKLHRFVPTEGWDYICFTDNPKIHSTQWTIALIQNPWGLDPIRLARRVKILHYQYLQGYDLSLWVDGNYKILGKIDYERLIFMRHQQRQCIYEEAKACIRLKKDDVHIIKNQMNFYKKNGIPENSGLINSGIICRPINNERVNRFMDLWFYEVLSHSRRDQLSFNYILWKYGLIKPHYKTINPKQFKRVRHEAVGSYK